MFVGLSFLLVAFFSNAVQDDMFPGFAERDGAIVPQGFTATNTEAIGLLKDILRLRDSQPEGSDSHRRINEIAFDCMERLRDARDEAAEEAGRLRGHNVAHTTEARRGGFGSF